MCFVAGERNRNLRALGSKNLAVCCMVDSILWDARCRGASPVVCPNVVVNYYPAFVRVEPKPRVFGRNFAGKCIITIKSEAREMANRGVMDIPGHSQVESVLFLRIGVMVLYFLPVTLATYGRRFWDPNTTILEPHGKGSELLVA